MDSKYILPQNPKPFLDRNLYGYDDPLIDRVIIELKQSPAIVEYLQKRAIDLATNLILEIDVVTVEQVRNNLNCTYSGKISELKELFNYSQAQLNPNHKDT